MTDERRPGEMPGDHEYDPGEQVVFEAADNALYRGQIDRQPSDEEPWYLIYAEDGGLYCIKEDDISRDH